MKNFLVSLGILCSMFFALPALATSGACSSHGGVDCSAGPDSDGSVICVDGWLNSSVSYSSMKKCAGTKLPSVQINPVIEQEEVLKVVENVSGFTDVNSNTRFSLAINSLKTSGVIGGYVDGSFKPLNKINRAEFVKILVASKYGEPSDSENNNCFEDVAKNQWYTKYVCKSKSEGIVGGYADGTFRPEQQINYAEALKLILEANNLVSATEGNVWYEKYVDSAKLKSIYIDGIGIDQAINRAEMAELMFRVKN
jgi:hypothetical protein